MGEYHQHNEKFVQEQQIQLSSPCSMHKKLHRLGNYFIHRTHLEFFAEVKKPAHHHVALLGIQHQTRCHFDTVRA